MIRSFGPHRKGEIVTPDDGVANIWLRCKFIEPEQKPLADNPPKNKAMKRRRVNRKDKD